MVTFTKAEYHEKWEAVGKSFAENPDRTVVLKFKSF